MRDLRGVIIVIFVHQQFLGVVVGVGSGSAVVEVWRRNPFGVAVGAFSGYRDGANLDVRDQRKCFARNSRNACSNALLGVAGTVPVRPRYGRESPRSPG
jgi:hypothetical protein